MMTHTWFWKTRLPERKGQPCKVLAHGKMNSILVEFQDGYKVVTSRYAVRLANTACTGRAGTVAKKRTGSKPAAGYANR